MESWRLHPPSSALKPPGAGCSIPDILVSSFITTRDYFFNAPITAATGCSTGTKGATAGMILPTTGHTLAGLNRFSSGWLKSMVIHDGDIIICIIVEF